MRTDVFLSSSSWDEEKGEGSLPLNDTILAHSTSQSFPDVPDVPLNPGHTGRRSS